MKKPSLIVSLLIFSCAAFAQNETSVVVTAASYANFLNAVAVNDEQHLYNEAMASDPSAACIVRFRESGSFHYEVIAGRENFPVMYMTLLAQKYYEAWIKNGQLPGEEPPALAQSAMAWYDQGTEDFFLACNKLDFSVESSDATATLFYGEAIIHSSIDGFSLKTGLEVALGLVVAGGFGYSFYDECYGDQNIRRSSISRSLVSCLNGDDSASISSGRFSGTSASRVSLKVKAGNAAKIISKAEILADGNVVTDQVMQLDQRASQSLPILEYQFLEVSDAHDDFQEKEKLVNIIDAFHEQSDFQDKDEGVSHEVIQTPMSDGDVDQFNQLISSIEKKLEEINAVKAASLEAIAERAWNNINFPLDTAENFFNERDDISRKVDDGLARIKKQHEIWQTDFSHKQPELAKQLKDIALDISPKKSEAKEMLKLSWQVLHIAEVNYRNKPSDKHKSALQEAQQGAAKALLAFKAVRIAAGELVQARQEEVVFDAFYKDASPSDQEKMTAKRAEIAAKRAKWEKGFSAASEASMSIHNSMRVSIKSSKVSGCKIDSNFQILQGLINPQVPGASSDEDERMPVEKDDRKFKKEDNKKQNAFESL